MKITVKYGLLLVIALVHLFSCTNSESPNSEETEKKDSLYKIAQFGDMMIVGDTNIFDGRLWRLEVILGDDRISLDTINRVLKIIELDLDDNQNPEIYIQTQAVGSGSYGKLYGFTSNEDGKLTAILFPEYHKGQFDSLFLIIQDMIFMNFILQKLFVGFQDTKIMIQIVVHH